MSLPSRLIKPKKELDFFGNFFYSRPHSYRLSTFIEQAKEAYQNKKLSKTALNCLIRWAIKNAKPID